MTETQQTDLSEIDKLLGDRDSRYGKSWLTTNQIINFLWMRMPELIASDLGFNWIMILNKLIRALATPKDREHWIDIVGYAQLSLNHLDTRAKIPVVDVTGRPTTEDPFPGRGT